MAALRLLGAATLSGLAAVASLILATVLGAYPSGLAPVSGLWVGALAGLGALLAMCRREPRLRLAVILSWLSLAPVVLLGAAWAMAGQPLVVSDWMCGTGLVGLLVLFPFLALVLPFVSTICLGWVLRRCRARTVSMTLALGVSALGAALSVNTFLHDDGVEPDAWVSSLPVVASARPSQLGASLGPFRVEHTEEGGARYVTYAPTEGPEDAYAERFPAASDQSATLRRDARAGIWVLEIDQYTARALRDGDSRFTDVDVRDVRDELAVPAGWQWTAMSGSALALALLIVSWIAGRRPRWLATAREAIVADDSNTLVFDDGSLPARGVSAKPLRPGRALVVMSEGQPGYRSDGTTGALDARSGTAAEHRYQADVRKATWAALALVTATLSICPLLTALWVLC